MVDRIFIGGVSKPSYWLAVYKTTNYDEGFGVSVSPSGQIYSVGAVYSNTEGTNEDFGVLRINNNGSLNWQKYIKTNFNVDVGYGVSATSAGVFVSGQLAGYTRGYTALLTTTGELSWESLLSNSRFFSIAADSSGNNYSCGNGDVLNTPVAYLVKRDSSGTILWQRSLSEGVDTQGSSVAVDASGGVYITVYGSGTGYLVKYDSSGTLQWQRVFNASNVKGVARAADGSIYCCSSFGGLELRKYNSSGVLQWFRKLGSAGNEQATAVACDAASNVYVCGTTSSYGSMDMLIAKYSPSGSLLWQRRLGTSSAIESANGIAVDPTNRVILTGHVRMGGSTMQYFQYFAAALPSDGSLTGSYVLDGATFNYAATTLALGTSGSDSAGALSDAGFTSTTYTTTITTGDSGLTSSVTNI